MIAEAAEVVVEKIENKSSLYHSGLLRIRNIPGFEESSEMADSEKLLTILNYVDKSLISRGMSLQKNAVSVTLQIRDMKSFPPLNKLYVE